MSMFMASIGCYVVGKLWDSWLDLLLFLAFSFRFLRQFALLPSRWDADFVLVILLLI